MRNIKFYGIISLIILLFISSYKYYCKEDVITFNYEEEKECIKNINFTECKNSSNQRIINIALKKDINISSTAVTMTYILNNINNNPECILQKLKIDKNTNKWKAVQRINNFITFFTNYSSDNKITEGVETPHLFIARLSGDCEDKAMFGLSLFNYLGYNVEILRNLPKNNSIGHIALKIKQGLFENDIIFDPADLKYADIYNIKQDQNRIYDVSYRLDTLQKILDNEENYTVVKNTHILIESKYNNY